MCLLYFHPIPWTSIHPISLPPLHSSIPFHFSFLYFPFLFLPLHPKNSSSFQTSPFSTNMASPLQKLLPTLLFLSTILQFQGRLSAQECPYPCYPPPTGTGNNPPLTTTPPAGGGGGGAAYNPPAAGGGGANNPPAFYGPPVGVIPYYPPPGGFSGVTPPPPDPILPWFPFYPRKPPHSELSSSTAMQASLKAMIIAVIPFLVFSLCSTN